MWKLPYYVTRFTRLSTNSTNKVTNGCLIAELVVRLFGFRRYFWTRSVVVKRYYLRLEMRNARAAYIRKESRLKVRLL